MFRNPKFYDKIEIITLQSIWNVSTDIAEKILWRDTKRHFTHWRWTHESCDCFGFWINDAKMDWKKIVAYILS